MISLSDKHYLAIGRVTVESCTLDREVGEYLNRLGVPASARTMIGRKLALLSDFITSRGLAPAVNAEFVFLFDKIRSIIARRNALAHGVWVPDPNASFDETLAQHEGTDVRAVDIAVLADRLHDARKLLFLTLHAELPAATGTKAVPNELPVNLKRRLAQI